MCGTFRNYTHESNLWISAGGTRSVVHYDADHNFHCIIDGRKDFIMIPNNLATKTNLYFKQKVNICFIICLAKFSLDVFWITCLPSNEQILSFQISSGNLPQQTFSYIIIKNSLL